MSSNDKRSEKFGFNWTKNNALLPTNAGREMMEDLHPDGSLLRIYNAHVSNFHKLSEKFAGAGMRRLKVNQCKHTHPCERPREKLAASKFALARCRIIMN
jgi:hypothetical protein